MKVVLDLTRLLQDGKITREEHDRLLGFAARETGSLAINILIGLGVIAVSAGVLALLMNAIAVIVLGAVILAAGLGITYSAARQWSVLATIFTLVGALMVAGGIVVLGEGNLGSLLLGTLVLDRLRHSGPVEPPHRPRRARARRLHRRQHRSYWHASYELTITEPTVTIVLFGALALADLSGLASGRQRLRAPRPDGGAGFGLPGQFRLLGGLAVGRQPGAAAGAPASRSRRLPPPPNDP